MTPGQPVDPVTQRGATVRTRIRTVLLILALSALAALGAEGTARLFSRWRTGQWPVTESVRVAAALERTTRLFRNHPYLNTTAREGAHLEHDGRDVAFNALGYRSPPRSERKPEDTVRIVCAGGSTTFDWLADSDADAWPSLVEQRIRGQGQAAEVWNSGLPGWTSLENLIALSIRDVNLRPDLVVLHQGINDLQPAAHVPFSRQYEPFHADVARQSFGLTVWGARPEAPPWYERSILVERGREALFGPRHIWPPTAALSTLPRLSRIPDEAVAVFERNVRSFIEVARAHGAHVMLVTQVIRLRRRTPDADAKYVELWIPGLRASAAVTELERLNDVLRRVAATEQVSLADAARDIKWKDRDFGDPLHYSFNGSHKLAVYLGDQALSILTANRNRAP